MNELALFAGAGGGILGGKLLGWRTVCAVEIDPYARKVLLARQADGCLEPFPIWDDVTTFDGHQWRGHVDVVSGGFPCQDISIAGKGAGLDGERSGLWAEMVRIISEVQPTYVWVENSPMLLVRGIDRVLWDLAAMGYDARWGIVGACDAGAPHKRERFWLAGFHTDKGYACGNQPDAGSNQNACKWTTAQVEQERNGWRNELGAVDVAQRVATYSDAVRILHGMADRVDRLECLGNGQVPAVVRLAWETLMGASTTNPVAVHHSDAPYGGGFFGADDRPKKS